MSLTQINQWSPTENTDNQISVSDSALNFMRQQIKKKGKGLGVHFGIKKSGCSGYTYVLNVIEDLQSFPYQFKIAEDFTLVVDEKSWFFVRGTKIDYVFQGLNGVLKYNNPNEKSACGCGESFSVEK
jgi:iron-sulfur cluster assembly protein